MKRDAKVLNVPEPLLVSAIRLARMLSCSVRTIWRLKASGALPTPVKLGASVRWDRRDIERWLDDLKGGCNRGRC